MSIDWITVAAQLANFLVLVWLLKWFLYRPILDGIDAREAEITERMEVATRAKQDAQAAQATYAAKRDALQSEQAQLAETSRLEAEHARDAMLTEAHERIDRERDAWHAHLDAEVESFAIRLQRAGGHALLELTRKAVNDLADATLEQQIAAHLSAQIAEMDGALSDAAGAPKVADIISRLPLQDAARDILRRAIVGRFANIEIRFETDDAQPPGVAVQLGGAQLVWTVDSYIDGLGAALNDQLKMGHDARMGAL